MRTAVPLREQALQVLEERGIKGLRQAVKDELV
jgi:hypothetical protein